MKKNKSKMNGKQKFSLLTTIITVLAHNFVVALVIMSYKYSRLEMRTFVSAIGIVVTLLIIIDILFVVGFNMRDHKIKIANCILATLVLVVGLCGTLVIGKVNKTVGNIIENDGIEQYEEIGVNFVTYENPSIKELTDLDNKKVGVVSASGVSATSVGQEKLAKEKIEPKYVEYSTLNELFLGLLNDEIDSAILQSGYRSILSTNDAYEEYIEDLVDVYSFSEKVKVGENASANKNLAVEPFNILLIGFAPEGPTSGLADSIILASVNPLTMTVTLTSVPRDSFVPIACYAGQAKDKITHSRAYGRECLMDTVGNLFDIDVDLYMEVNFLGLVDIVDAVGGIWIDSPVEFVGQTPSWDRGEYTVWVGQGGQMADGKQALAFARERHAMPNGDLDRAIHQQEVIAQIAEKLINLRDVNQALKVMKAAGDNFSTNLSLNQLTTIFNYIVTAPNNNGLSAIQNIDIQSMRLSGYGSRSYNEGMELPLYVYPLYKGSIKQCDDRIADTLGNYSSIKQDDYFKFFAEYPYNRGQLYSDSFNEQQIHEELPGFVLNFVRDGASLSEVEAWASQYGVNLNVVYVQEGDPRYVEGAEGLVVDMSEKYGRLASKIDTLTVWVCGELDPADKIPSFIGRPLKEAEDWANANGYKLNVNIVGKDDPSFVSDKAGQIFKQSIEAGKNKNNFDEITISAYEFVKKKVDYSSILNYGKTTKDDILAWASSNGIPSGNIKFAEDAAPEGTDYPVGTLIKEPTFSNADGASGGPFQDSTFTFVLVKKAEHEHDFSIVIEKVDATTESEGYIIYKCSGCEETKKVILPKLEETVTDPDSTQDPNKDPNKDPNQDSAPVPDAN